MNATSSSLRCAGRTFSEGELQVVADVVANGGRPLGSRTRVPRTAAGEPGQPLLGTVGQFGTVSLQPVTWVRAR